MKKAQVTIFIIIGVLLVAVAGIVFYMTSISGQVPESEIEVIAEEVPNQVKPIKEFVEECVKSVSKEAIEKMGRHGGYIDPQDTEYSPLFVMDPMKPYEADGVYMTSSYNSFVPYYWYLESDTKCELCVQTNKLIPRSETIEEQINKYVNNNLVRCLDNFVGFEAQGFEVVPQGPIKTVTLLTQQDVAIRTTYPLAVTVGGSTTQVSDYVVRQPVQLLKIIRLSRNLALAENLVTYLENTLIRLIIAYSGSSADKLPPLSLTEESYSKRFWVKMIQEQRVQDLLTTYTPLFYVNLTGRENPGETIVEKALFDTMTINVPTDLEDVEVTFLFFKWPIYLDITPNEGQILTAYDTLKQNLLMAAPIRTQKYKFFYDVAWPVVVEIRIKNAFFGEGYSYLFALEGNIKDNKNLRDFLEGRGTVGPYTPLYEMSVDESLLQDPKYENTTQILGQPRANSLLCSMKQRIGSNLVLNITSVDVNVDIKKARVTFGCGMHAQCELEPAIMNKNTNNTIGEYKLPVCMNGGYIKVEADEHKAKYVAKVSSEQNTNLSFDVELKKLYKVNVTFKKLPFTRNIISRDDVNDYQGTYETTLTPLVPTDVDPTDMLIMRLEREQGVDELFPGMPGIVLIDPENEVYMTEVWMAPGKYSLSANLFDKAGATIAKEWRCYHRDSNDKCDAEAWVPEDDQTIDILVSGGLEIGELVGYWSVTEEQLKGKEKLQVTLVQLPIPLIIEDLQEMGNVENVSVENALLLKPQLI
ncbi:hypothetical protein ACFL0V_06075 [Nanoarchaeota archaeon]